MKIEVEQSYQRISFLLSITIGIMLLTSLVGLSTYIYLCVSSPGEVVFGMTLTPELITVAKYVGLITALFSFVRLVLLWRWQRSITL